MPIEERTIGSRKIHPKHLLIEKASATIELSQLVSPSNDRETWIVDLYHRLPLSNPSGSMMVDSVTTGSGMTVFDAAGIVWITSSGAWEQYPQQPTPGDLVSVVRGKKYGGQTLLVTNDVVRTSNAAIADGYSLPDPVPDMPDDTSRLVPETMLVEDDSVTLVPCWQLNATEAGAIYQVSSSVQIVTNVLPTATRCYLDLYRGGAFYARLDSRIIEPATPVAFLVLSGSLLVEGDGEYDLRLWANASFNVPVVQGWEKLLRITSHRLR